jgi:hypothetical protein
MAGCTLNIELTDALAARLLLSLKLLSACPIFLTLATYIGLLQRLLT